MKHACAVTILVTMLVLGCERVPMEPRPSGLSLPTHPVKAVHVWMSGKTSEYDLKLSGIGDGYDLEDGSYPGWCVEDNLQGNSDTVVLYSSYDRRMPDDIKYYRDPSAPPGMTGLPVPWDRLNYLLNHKQGSIRDIGAGIFLLMWGETASFPASLNARTMARKAAANGDGFVPQSGQVMAIILYQDGIGDGKDPEDRPRRFQDTFIEYIIP